MEQLKGQWRAGIGGYCEHAGTLGSATVEAARASAILLKASFLVAVAVVATEASSTSSTFRAGGCFVNGASASSSSRGCCGDSLHLDATAARSA